MSAARDDRITVVRIGVPVELSYRLGYTLCQCPRPCEIKRSMRSSRFAQFALLLALLFVQSAALAHAAEHPFHEQDAHCALFKVVDSQGHALAPSDLVS